MGKKDHSQQRLPVEHYRKTLGTVLFYLVVCASTAVSTQLSFLGKNEKKVQHRDIKSGKLRSSKADLNSGGVGLAVSLRVCVFQASNNIYIC